jgi:uncharacterized protein (TIGR03067 family)
MKTAFAILAAVFTVAAATVWADDDASEMAKFQGSWVITGFATKGQQLPLAPGKKVMLTFSKDGKVVSEGGDQGKQEGTYKIDSTRKPKYIDIANDRESMVGIYTIEGDKLTIAVAVPTKKEVDEKTARARPLTLEGDTVLTITLTREKGK